ncbi:hypothetical protein AMTRI_Chr04g253550 [Amborella trichopoda]
MKFGKEFKAQMVPEWQEAYMDYDYLKTVLKDITHFKERRKNPAPSSGGAVNRRMTMYRAFSGLTRRYSNRHHQNKEEQVILVNSQLQDGVEGHETMFLRSFDEGGEYELVFFRRLDEEFNKVNHFYKPKVEEMVNEAHSLDKQMEALIALRIIVDKPDFLNGWTPPPPADAASRPPPPPASAPLGTPTPANIRKSGQLHLEVINEVELSSDISDDPNANSAGPNVSNRKAPPEKLNGLASGPAPLDLLKHVKINITPETPRSTIQSLLMDHNIRDLQLNKNELRKTEERLKNAFIEFHRKLRVLKSYCSLNLLAFSKIMKKYDKLSGRHASRSYLDMVDKSYLGSSEEVNRLLERVEATFIKHFANSNRVKGMNALRPKPKRQKHRITFFVGLFAGCSVALILTIGILIRVRQLPNEVGSTQYMAVIFPLYSLFLYIVLHMLMYAANIYFWKRYRVNYPFIFGFKQGTELGYIEVLLLSSGLSVLALASVISNLDMEMDPKTKSFETLTELVPLGLTTLVLLILLCPFNIIYRSSRFFLLQCAFHCICAPFYKVILPDFFLADQLTSQVHAIRGLLGYVCYYGWGDFKRRVNGCSSSSVYTSFFFIVAVIPYWSRFLQCLRRLYEEKDPMQGYNAIKYFSTIVALVLRTSLSVQKREHWRILAVVSSVVATLLGTYWDLVIDWGLLQPNSENPWLRDKLLIPQKNVYFIAMVLNVILRLAWLQTVLGFEIQGIHFTALTAIVACLEIIRRGIWNFFRLENEHLNNVGKYRAFKSVPLPFQYEEDDHED